MIICFFFFRLVVPLPVCVPVTCSTSHQRSTTVCLDLFSLVITESLLCDLEHFTCGVDALFCTLLTARLGPSVLTEMLNEADRTYGPRCPDSKARSGISKGLYLRIFLRPSALMTHLVLSDLHPSALMTHLALSDLRPSALTNHLALSDLRPSALTNHLVLSDLQKKNY